jgi:two-component system, NtrC family, nitrogen regulation sensor histidine kinase NtrY
MSFRKKLLLLFAVTVLLCVAVISASVYSTIQRSFEQANQDRANAIAAQFRSEFQRRGAEVARKLESVAASETVQRIALDASRGVTDTGEYVSEARTLAGQQRLDFLELVDSRGTILSSAQWQAKFGYPEAAIPPTTPPAIPQSTVSPATTPADAVRAGAFLKREELPDGATLGLFAVRALRLGEQPLYVIGGERLDQGFLSTLDIPAGTRVLLYQNLNPQWNPKSLLDLNGPAAGADKVASLVAKVRENSALQESQAVIHWTSDSADAEVFHAIPLTGPLPNASNQGALDLASADPVAANQQLMGVLLVGSSRRPLIELQKQIISTAMLVGGIGVLVAVLASLWFGARVTRPVVSLAGAARRVAAGDLGAKVEVESSDELGELARSFNRMTEDLVQQKDRTVQAERVAAWRELARRLAHELKNPLFPLQVTVENLVRAKQKSPEMFEEVFQEGTATLLAEINNLKTIIGHFSEFSKMPQPQPQPTQVNDVVRSVLSVFHAQLQQAQLREKNRIAVHTALAEPLPEISVDPDLLHRALQNLVLNAIDAMPEGGELTLRTASLGDRIEVSISDTGSGLTSEECGRLFTPYYTTKQHGTGLGLAIVQSVVSDHGGKISVESAKEKGTTFRIELPRTSPSWRTGQI